MISPDEMRVYAEHQDTTWAQTAEIAERFDLLISLIKADREVLAPEIAEIAERLDLLISLSRAASPDAVAQRLRETLTPSFPRGYPLVDHDAENGVLRVWFGPSETEQTAVPLGELIFLISQGRCVGFEILHWEELRRAAIQRLLDHIKGEGHGPREVQGDQGGAPGR